MANLYGTGGKFDKAVENLQSGGPAKTPEIAPAPKESIEQGNFRGLRDLGKASTSADSLGQSSSGLSSSIINKGNAALRANGYSQGPANFDKSARTDTGLSMDAVRRGNANLRAGFLTDQANFKSPTGWKGGQGSFGTPGDADKALNQGRQANEIRQGIIDSNTPEALGFNKLTYVPNEREKIGRETIPVDVPESVPDRAILIPNSRGSIEQSKATADQGDAVTDLKERNDTISEESDTLRFQRIANRRKLMEQRMQEQKQGLRGMAKGGLVYDEDAEARRQAASQAARSAEEGGGMHRPSKAYSAPKAKDWNDPRPEPGTTVHRLAPELPRVVDVNQEKGMRGYNKGGCVTPKNKVKQPGYAKGGKIMLPPEAPGAIGDVEMDTGADTEQVAVRPGEYLLNPETVAFLGQGDYETGVRNLNQLVEQATGQAPGPEMVEAPEGDGEMMEGFAYGGPTTGLYELNELGEVRARAPGYLETGVLRTGSPMNAGQASGQRVMPPPDVVVDRTAQPAAAAADTAQTPRGERWGRAGERAGEAMRQKYGTAKEIGKKFAKVGALPAIGGVIEVARQVGDKQKNQFYNDPNIPAEEKALQAGSDVVDTGLRYGGGVLGGSIGAAAGLGTPGSLVLGGAGAVGGYTLGDMAWKGDNEALQAYRAANPVASPAPGSTIDPKAYADTLYNGMRPNLVAPEQGMRNFSSPEGNVITQADATAPQRLTEDQMIANYLAMNGQNAGAEVNAGNLRQIPGTNARYAGNYGNQEVIVTRGANGEPTFTGLRSPEEIAASEARAVEAARPKTTEEILRERVAYLNSSWEPDAVRARENGEAGKLAETLAGIETAKIDAAGRAAPPMSPGELSKDMVQTLEPLFAEYGDGAPQAMSQFIQDISGMAIEDGQGGVVSAGPNFNRLPPDEQARLFADWKDRNQLAARTQKGLKRAGSDETLAPGLRGLPKFKNMAPATFSDAMNPNSDYGILEYGNDRFNPWSEGLPNMVDVVPPGMDPNSNTFRLNADEIVGDDQLRRAALAKQLNRGQ